MIFLVYNSLGFCRKKKLELPGGFPSKKTTMVKKIIPFPKSWDLCQNISRRNIEVCSSRWPIFEVEKNSPNWRNAAKNLW